MLDLLDDVEHQPAEALRHRHVIQRFCLFQDLLEVLHDLRDKGDQRLFENLGRLPVDLYHFFSSVLLARDQLGRAARATLRRDIVVEAGERRQEGVHPVRVDDVLRHELVELFLGLRDSQRISQLAERHVQMVLEVRDAFYVWEERVAFLAGAVLLLLGLSVGGHSLVHGSSQVRRAERRPVHSVVVHAEADGAEYICLLGRVLDYVERRILWQTHLSKFEI